MKLDGLEVVSLPHLLRVQTQVLDVTQAYPEFQPRPCKLKQSPGSHDQRSSTERLTVDQTGKPIPYTQGTLSHAGAISGSLVQALLPDLKSARGGPID